MRKLNQKKFEELLRQAKPGIDICFFPNCKDPPQLTIRVNNKDYGVCKSHWDLMPEVEISYRGPKEPKKTQTLLTLNIIF